MSPAIRICAGLFLVVFLYYVVKLVRKGRLRLRYSVMWMFLGVVALLVDAFPAILFWASDLIGFVSPSNLLLMVAVMVLLVVCLSLSVSVSRSVTAVKNLTQRVAILEKEIEVERAKRP